MKFREVTWYSKLLALALFVVLPFAGFYAGMWYQKNISLGTNDIVANGSKDASDSASQNGWREIVDSEKII
ncbi:MAG: hypothetical protein A2172_01655 [Candidatus Woykebacteria bacterium RBG_13_40_15]|uniref:Uncharacterized protein n=1 Tax=Candidatus Woykebacteria bacterium RBG_13_40_15 TaxID=1802593 RepID=A0A1G1W9T0_9BACT|nr:MAG: hypothetical protein A2172_01655 [Candidatus Woykebacteria bacterium RBG_13_40_15]